MKIFYFVTLLLSPVFVIADSNKPPPGYWSYDGEAISFCFRFRQEDICSKLPMQELQKIIINSEKNKGNRISSLYKNSDYLYPEESNKI